MPRLPSDPVARLVKLEAARAVIGADETFNGANMARIAGMTWRNMREIVAGDPDFPVLVRGSEGVAFEFNGAAVLDYMIVQARAVQADRGRRADRATYLAGLGGAAASPPADGGNGPGPAALETLSVADIGKLVQVNREFQRARIEQGELVAAAEQERAAMSYNSVVQAALLDSAQRADPTGAWPTEMRAAWENSIRSMLVHIQDEANKWLASIPKGKSGE